MNDDKTEDYYLDQNIDCDIVPFNINSGFLPIGSDGTEFTGSFDGKGFIIDGLYINRSGTDYVGLFGDTTTGTSFLKNVTFLNANIIGNRYVGILSGHTYCNVDDINISGVVVGNDDYIGGIIGSSAGNVSNSYFNGNVSGIEWVGGLLGRSFSGVYNSSSNGNISGSLTVGGLIGKSKSSLPTNIASVDNSFSTGNVFGSTSVGGLVGSNEDNITNSYSHANVIAINGGGGLTGPNTGNIITSYSTGKITSDAVAGGISQYNTGLIYYSSTTSDVSDSTGLVGTIVGDSFGGEIYFSYYDNNSAVSSFYCMGNTVFPQGNNDGCEILDNYGFPISVKDDMYQDYWIKNALTLRWPFHNIWEEYNNNYPVFAWQNIGHPIYTSAIRLLTFPLNKIYYTNVTAFSHQIIPGYSLGNICNYSVDGGITNITTTCGIYPNEFNTTGLNAHEGNNTWTLYANSLSGGFTEKSISFFVDLIRYPLINITSISTILNSQTFSFNSTATDGNLDSCWYSIYNSLGNIDGLNNQVPYVCNLNVTATVTAFGNYNLTIYTNDTIGNENNITQSFNTSVTSVPTVLPGGSSTPSITVIGANSTWSAKTETGGDYYDFVMSLGGSRTKGIIYTNMGDYDIILDISCDDITENLCDYVELSDESITLKPGEIKGITFTLQLPDEAGHIEGIVEQTFLEEGRYEVNIIAKNEADGSQAPLLVRARVGTYGTFSWIVQQITGMTILPFGTDGFEIFNFFLLLFPFLTVGPFLYYFVFRNINIKLPLTFMITFLISIIILFIL